MGALHHRVTPYIDYLESNVLVAVPCVYFVAPSPFRTELYVVFVFLVAWLGVFVAPCGQPIRARCLEESSLDFSLCKRPTIEIPHTKIKDSIGFVKIEFHLYI